MSTTFGSTDTLADCSLDERLAARLLSAWLPLVDAQFDNGGIRFDRDRLRIALHGESEQPGDGYTRGMVVMGLWMMNALLGTLPVWLVTGLSPLQSPPLPVALVAIVALLATASVAITLAMGSVGALVKTELVDHTVPKQPDAVDDLKDRYVAGDLDDAELEREAAEVWDR